MSDSTHQDTQENIATTGESKKISLADAIKNKLAKKKQAQQDPKGTNQLRAGNASVMKSQNNKKPNNQRRRTGGS